MAKSLSILVVLCFLARLQFCMSFSQPIKIISVDVERSHLPLLDRKGRERFFRGSNMVVKHAPYIPSFQRYDPTTSFVDQDVKLFVDLGWNLVRLGFMWPGAEPERGCYNETYFSLMKQLVRKLGDNGIYVLLDFHQDVLSEQFCGEGVPPWAALPRKPNFPVPLTVDPFLLNSSGVPSKQDCDRFFWSDYYLSDAASTAFQALYDNQDGILDSLTQLWTRIAKDFGTMENLIGYNLINEPWAGNVYAHPTLLVPGNADRVNLQPMYERLAKGIHSVDNQSLIIFEPVTWDNWAFGFTEVPGGSEYRNRSLVGYHYYRPPRVESAETAMTLQKAASRRLGCGCLLTEFWTCSGSDSDPIGTLQTVKSAEDALQSWIGWQYKPDGIVLPNGTLDLQLAYILSRPYPVAVAGKTLATFYDAQLGVFYLQYNVDAALRAPTELFIPKLQYPQGYVVSVLPSGAAKYVKKSRDSLLLIQHTKRAQNGARLDIRVRRLPF